MITNAMRTPRPSRASTGRERRGSFTAGTSALVDDRWGVIRRALADLRAAGRHSVRIVDADCGAGNLLIHAAQYARTLGFTAIEGRGIDGAPSLIARARATAGRLHDPAIGLSFDVADLLAALREEAVYPADILLWNGRPAAFEQGSALDALRRAATCLIVGSCRPRAEAVEQQS